MIRFRRMTFTHLFVVVLAAGLCLPAASQDDPIPNFDLSAGAEGWTEWTGNVAHHWEVEPTGGPDGGPALRIDAANAANNVMVINRDCCKTHLT